MKKRKRTAQEKIRAIQMLSGILVPVLVQILPYADRGTYRNVWEIAGELFRKPEWHLVYGIFGLMEGNSRFISDPSCAPDPAQRNGNPVQTSGMAVFSRYLYHDVHRDNSMRCFQLRTLRLSLCMSGFRKKQKKGKKHGRRRGKRSRNRKKEENRLCIFQGNTRKSCIRSSGGCGENRCPPRCL